MPYSLMLQLQRGLPTGMSKPGVTLDPPEGDEEEAPSSSKA